MQLVPCATSASSAVQGNQRWQLQADGSLAFSGIPGQYLAMQSPSPVAATTCPETGTCLNVVLGSNPVLFNASAIDGNQTILRTIVAGVGDVCLRSDLTHSHGYLPNVYLGACTSGVDTWTFAPQTQGQSQRRSSHEGAAVVNSMAPWHQCLDVGSGGSGLGNFSLKLKPAAVPALQALNSSNFTSWGGSVIRDDKGRYHMFCAMMEDGAGLQQWGSKSSILHAVADTPTGPYTPKETVVKPFAHNPQVTRARDGTYLLFFIGGPRLMNASGLDGPWDAVPGAPDCNNPAPVVLPHTDEMFLVCHNGGAPSPGAGVDAPMHWGSSVQMYSAPSWRGPWRFWANNTLDAYDRGQALFNHPVEDPTLWVGPDGTWHMLVHAFRMGMVNKTGGSGNAYGGYAWSPGPDGPWTFQEDTLA